MSVALSLLITVLAASPAVAQDRLDALAAAIDRAVAAPAAETAAVPRMAAFLGTTPETLRAEHAATRLGWGDLFVAHRIATRGRHPVDKVVAARRTPATWGTIADEAGVEADVIVQDVTALWPDAARATSSGVSGPVPPGPVTAPAPPRGLGARVLDVLRGAPGDKTDERAPDEPAAAERPADAVRDRMIRGGGVRTR